MKSTDHEEQSLRWESGEKALFFVYFQNPFLKYLAKISFNRKMTELVRSPWFNNFWIIFRMFLRQKNYGVYLDLGVVKIEIRSE